MISADVLLLLLGKSKGTPAEASAQGYLQRKKMASGSTSTLRKAKRALAIASGKRKPWQPRYKHPEQGDWIYP